MCMFSAHAVIELVAGPTSADSAEQGMCPNSVRCARLESTHDRRVNGRLDLQPSLRHSCGRFRAQTLDNAS